jgi:DNA-binding MarR family transcriptional regulator
MQDTNTLRLIERISSLLRANERRKYAVLGLQPIHGQILEYLSICNSYSDTLVAVAEYLHLTKGTVSQSIQVLQRKGYIEKFPDEDDRRITHIKLLPLGEKIIKPVDYFKPVTAEAPTSESSVLLGALEKTLASLQRVNKVRTFGTCTTCKYFSEEEEHYVCKASDHIVYSTEIEKACKEHIPVVLN